MILENTTLFSKFNLMAIFLIALFLEEEKVHLLLIIISFLVSKKHQEYTHGPNR